VPDSPLSAAPTASAPPRLDDALTREHLESALRDEAVAAVECAWFARIAEIEGQTEASRALREMAEQHELNARTTLDLLLRSREALIGARAGTTTQNLAVVERFYNRDAEAHTGRAGTARREGFSDIGSWFESVSRLRVAHAARLSALREETPDE
jgi:rubrerythrin